MATQIERANIINLDWALAHMESKKARQKVEDWVYEAELKDTAEDVSTVLQYGLGLKLMYSTNVGGSQGSWSSTFG